MNPVIQIENLSAGYGEKVILRDINCEIPPGEITVILGGSGCGKSTLLKSIVGLQEPLEGVVRMFGRDTSQLSESEHVDLLKNVGMLFQNGALLNSLSCAENVAIPLEQHTELADGTMQRIVRSKLALVNLPEAGHLSPAELSGGMRKRVALARAMALDPRLLFCDEPSAGLDPQSSALLDELLLMLRDRLEMTIVVVTHELASIHRIADRLLFLHDGNLVFNGTLKDAKGSGIDPVQEFFRVGAF